MTIDEFIVDSDPAVRPLLAATREYILDLHPMMSEKMRYKIPFFDYLGWLFYLNTRKDHIELGFINGAELADEEGVLTATDRKMIRHYRIHSLKDLRNPALRNLIQQAMLTREAGVSKRK
jgi:hypothetical protein